MTAGNEEQEPLISTSAEHQRVTYNASPQVSFILLIIYKKILYFISKRFNWGTKPVFSSMEISYKI